MSSEVGEKGWKIGKWRGSVEGIGFASNPFFVH
jgi:hypothetical protein